MVRFATEQYESPNFTNLDNVCQHLTNYAINKESPNFVFNTDSKRSDVGHKRSLKSVYEQLRKQVVAAVVSPNWIAAFDPSSWPAVS